MSLSCPYMHGRPINFDQRIWRLCRSIWIAPEEHTLVKKYGSAEAITAPRPIKRVCMANLRLRAEISATGWRQTPGTVPC
jgi:hypothetical protein